MTDTLYLALGDSTAAGVGARAGGYPERLLARLDVPGLRLTNLGESGATSSDVLARQLPRALRLRPSLVTLAVGVNDLGLQVPEEAFAANLEEIVIGLSRLNARVVIANLPDVALAPAVRRLVPAAYYERRIGLYNRHVEATAARHRLTLVDLFSISREALPGHPHYFSADGFHPSDEGYEIWAGALARAIRAPLGQSRAIPA